MSSGLKPILSQAAPPNASQSMSKPIHSQGPATYGQPSAHVPQNLTSMQQHGLPTPAHNSSTQNHYLNVPNTTYNAGMSIPASNHPIPNIAQSTPAYVSPPKPQFPANYQPPGHVMHPPQPALPTPQATVPSEPQEKPHSNGTVEMQGSQSGEQNHSVPPKEAVVDKPAQDKPTTPISTLTDESSNETKQQEENAPDVIDSSSSASIEGIEITTSNSSTAEVKTEEADVPNESANVTEVIAKAVVEPVKTETVVMTENVNSQSKEQATVKPNAKAGPSKGAQSKKAKIAKAEGGGEATQKPISKPDKPLVMKSPSRVKRARKKAQPFQYPLPELEIISKMTNTTKSTKRDNEEKLIIFYKNEFLAVRNAEGGFFICQAMQNIYKRSTKINIRWLSQDLEDKSGEVYIPDFYDVTDVDCILTNLELTRVDKVKFRLPPKEKTRTDSILRRALAVEKGETVPPSPTEEHPDGLDLSLYKEESQLQKVPPKGRERKPPTVKTVKAQKSIKAKKRLEHRVKKVVAARPKAKEPVKKEVRRKAPAPISAIDGKKTATNLTSSRSERAKRRHDTMDAEEKANPVIDAKKARVLAKVVKKVATTSTTMKKTAPIKKETKSVASRGAVKAPPTKKTRQEAQQPEQRKTKRTRK